MLVLHSRDKTARGFHKPFDLFSPGAALLWAGLRRRTVAAMVPVMMVACAVGAVVVGWSRPLRAQTVNAGVDLTSTITTMPEYGMGIHTSVYDNSLQYQGSPVYNLLDGRLDDAGINVLRYPGGGMISGVVSGSPKS